MRWYECVYACAFRDKQRVGKKQTHNFFFRISSLDVWFLIWAMNNGGLMVDTHIDFE